MNSTPQALPPTTKTALREELARVRAQLNEYVGHEPTIAEEMKYLGEENGRLRQIAAFLLLEYAEKSTVDLWDDDLAGYTGQLNIEPSPDRRESTRLTYTRGPARAPKRPRKPVDHRAEAERHASQAAHVKNDLQHHPVDPIATDFHLRMAQVHATLATGDGGAAGGADQRDALTLLRRREAAMRDLLAAHIAKALTSKDTNRWKAGRDLAQALDAGDANIDDAIDRHLADAGYESKTAWNGPGVAERIDDPWAPTPDITADVPEPVRRVLAGHLAEMLLDHGGDDGSVRSWARAITHELKREGVDLGDAIKKRIHDITLGPGPADAPF